MTFPMTTKEKQTIKTDYEKAVAAYVKAFCKRMEMSFGHWVGDEVGGMADFNDYFTVSFLDVKMCVDMDVTRDTFIAWYDYGVEVDSLGIKATIPNLKSWLMGFRGLPEEDIERFKQMKRDLMAEAEKLEEKSKQQKF